LQGTKTKAVVERVLPWEAFQRPGTGSLGLTHIAVTLKRSAGRDATNAGSKVWQRPLPGFTKVGTPSRGPRKKDKITAKLKKRKHQVNKQARGAVRPAPKTALTMVGGSKKRR